MFVWMSFFGFGLSCEKVCAQTKICSRENVQKKYPKMRTKMCTKTPIIRCWKLYDILLPLLKCAHTHEYVSSKVTKYRSNIYYHF